MSASLCNGQLAALARSGIGAASVTAGQADAEADNPLCGDEIRIRLVWRQEGGCPVLERLEHCTRGCAVCRASASLAAVATAGKTRAELLALADAFDTCLASGDFSSLGGDFRVFDGISSFPSRRHCARLPWTALRRALGGRRVGETPAI